MCVCWTESRFFVVVGMAMEKGWFFTYSFCSDKKRGGVMSVRGEEGTEPAIQHNEE